MSEVIIKPQFCLPEICRHTLRYHSDDIRAELLNSQQYQAVHKDIIIVVHDQLECIQNCINSIKRYTKDYTLHIWDNASQAATAEYLKSLECDLIRSEENLGFIIPNNRMVERCKSPYIILLNSDTIVRQGWDEMMIAWMQTHPDVGAVAYMGGKLNSQMIGDRGALGNDVDYLCGWCLCFPKYIYDEIGLFDEENLEFAYGEDSDFSLRIKDAGKSLYAMCSDFVLHWGGKTVAVVQHEKNTSQSFLKNHDYLVRRWGKSEVSKN